MNLSTLSYGVAALANLALSFLLAGVWRSHPLARRLLVASVLAALWAMAIAVGSFSGRLSFPLVYLLEMGRDAGLLWVLIGVFGAAAPRWLRWTVFTAWISCLLVGLLGPALIWRHAIIPIDPVQLMTRGSLILAFLGLLLVEQAHRNASKKAREWLNVLLASVGSQFAYDFFLYAQSELLKSLSVFAWAARGLFVAASAPGIVWAVRKSQRADSPIFISRHIVFYSTTLAATGLYLCVMAVGGFYVREANDSWGDLLQTVFFAGAAGVLVSLLLSGALRRRLRVFISKHFYRNKYDYRFEWLRFVRTVSSVQPGNIRVGALKAVAQVFSSTGGYLFTRDDSDRFSSAAEVCAESETPDSSPPAIEDDSDLVQTLARGWIVDLEEYRITPANYDNIRMPPWLLENRSLRIVTPLMQSDKLTGILILAGPPAPFELTYEDRDLLMTIGRHVAVLLAQYDSDQRLAENRQFETFSRLTAFMMHDLKNCVAQLQLVVSNAPKFKGNPEFIDDSISTIDNAVGRITRLLEQLRSGEGESLRRPINLREVIGAVLDRCSERSPRPTTILPEYDVSVEADLDRLTNSIEHIVKNAQDATDSTGNIRIEVTCLGADAVVAIMDTGKGMDKEFVRQRLFRPFDTTKGSAGMGIGAYQVREYVRALGGRVEVQSGPGRGTRFAITLPVSKAGFRRD